MHVSLLPTLHQNICWPQSIYPRLWASQEVHKRIFLHRYSYLPKNIKKKHSHVCIWSLETFDNEHALQIGILMGKKMCRGCFPAPRPKFVLRPIFEPMIVCIRMRTSFIPQHVWREIEYYFSSAKDQKHHVHIPESWRNCTCTQEVLQNPYISPYIVVSNL
jgi:hypothetical protein